ncbi:hypothetical protein [Kitasatospora sp. NPDC088346]|uniref:hypothetical protein n=1 Tax=Kitasatospora sp. NPDC088346 TaxID=3364073 RepID=UPI0038228490
MVRQTVGEDVLPGIRATLAEQRPARSSAIWFAAAPAAGVVTEIGGLDEARTVDGVTEVQLLVRPGTACGALESSDSRLAYARAVAPDADRAVAAARAATARLEFHPAGTGRGDTARAVVRRREIDARQLRLAAAGRCRTLGGRSAVDAEVAGCPTAR